MERSVESREPQVASHSTPSQAAKESYNPPSFAMVGKSVSLTHQSSSGHLKDGTGGWWVWGS
jgi:hypothetical protein